eukprot:m.13689 g.13689  ORF g.13689 m.13689 type:complete len:407 (-) comp4630_c0_seq1:142-1362(-)
MSDTGSPNKRKRAVEDVPAAAKVIVAGGNGSNTTQGQQAVKQSPPAYVTAQAVDSVKPKQELHTRYDDTPPFLTKLMAMVNDPTTDNLISWSQNGNTIVVHNSSQLAKEVLPNYFKHSNFTSLVRQLNMYGFHKVIGVDDGAIQGTATHKGPGKEWEFVHPSVHRDKPELLVNVRRKDGASKKKLDKKEVGEVLSDLEALRGQNTAISTQFSSLQRENQLLWTEVRDLRQRHQQTQRQLAAMYSFLKRLIPRPAPIARPSRLMLQSSEPAAPSAMFQGGAAGTATTPSIMTLPDSPQRNPPVSSVDITQPMPMGLGATVDTLPTLESPAPDELTRSMTEQVEGFENLFGTAKQRLEQSGVHPSTLHGLVSAPELQWDTGVLENAMFEPLGDLDVGGEPMADTSQPA